jgi:hypothetical protein
LGNNKNEIFTNVINSVMTMACVQLYPLLCHQFFPLTTCGASNFASLTQSILGLHGIHLVLFEGLRIWNIIVLLTINHQFMSCVNFIKFTYQCYDSFQIRLAVGGVDLMHIIKFADLNVIGPYFVKLQSSFLA